MFFYCAQELVLSKAKQAFILENGKKAQCGNYAILLSFEKKIRENSNPRNLVPVLISRNFLRKNGEHNVEITEFLGRKTFVKVIPSLM